MLATFVRMWSFAAAFLWMYFAQSMLLGDTGISDASTANTRLVLNLASAPRFRTFLNPSTAEFPMHG